MIQPFAQGKDAWKSTLTKSRQNVDQIGRTSQNKMPQRKNNRFMNGEELLGKAMRPLKAKKK